MLLWVAVIIDAADLHVFHAISPFIVISISSLLLIATIVLLVRLIGVGRVERGDDRSPRDWILHVRVGEEGRARDGRVR